MISLEVTTTSVAGEVKLYLAVPSPLLSRPPLLGPVSGPSSFCHRTRSGSAAGSPRGAIQVHAEHSVLIRSGHGPTAPPSRLRYCQRTRRGPADGPPRALFHPLTTASAPRELRGGRTRKGPSHSAHAHSGTTTPSCLSCAMTVASSRRSRCCLSSDPRGRAELATLLWLPAGADHQELACDGR